MSRLIPLTMYKTYVTNQMNLAGDGEKRLFWLLAEERKVLREANQQAMAAEGSEKTAVLLGHMERLTHLRRLQAMYADNPAFV